jgi:hypothetical protein
MNQLIQQIRILSPKQLKEINEFINSNLDGFQGCTVFGDDGTPTANVDTSVRSSSYLFPHNDSKVVNILHVAMEKGLLEYRNRVKPVNTMFQYWPIPGSADTFFGRESVQLLRYKPGQKYLFHHDQADFPDQPEYHRTLSTVIYLNDGFEGGGTEFPHKTFKPKPGYALFFPSNWCYPHSGQEVISGEKRVAVTWWYAQKETQG